MNDYGNKGIEKPIFNLPPLPPTPAHVNPVVTTETMQKNAVKSQRTSIRKQKFSKKMITNLQNSTLVQAFQKISSFAVSQFNRIQNAKVLTTKSYEPVDIARINQTFDQIFGGNGGEDEAKVIASRMIIFAKDSRISPDVMATKVAAGFAVAKEITSPNHDSNKKHDINDLINLEWYMRAHVAKINKSFMNGTIRFPDQDNVFSTFVINCKGEYHGKEVDPIARRTSHWTEKRKAIHKNLIRLNNGDYVAFGSNAKKRAQNAAAQEKLGGKGKGFEFEGIGLDASGKSSLLGLAGKNKRTFMFMFLPDTDAKGNAILSIGMKTENYPIPKLTQFGYGKLRQRAKDFFLHSRSFLFKKVFKFQRYMVKEGYFYRGEDQLPANIKAWLAGTIKLKGNPKGSDIEKALHKSYRSLRNSRQRGSNYDLQRLLTHMQLTKETLPPGDDRDRVATLIAKIEAFNQEHINLLNGTQNPLLPRGKEVILPSLMEMVDNRTTFVSGY